MQAKYELPKKKKNEWDVNQWIKKAILLRFRVKKMKVDLILKLRVDLTLKNGNFYEFTSGSFSEKGL